MALRIQTLDITTDVTLDGVLYTAGTKLDLILGLVNPKFFDDMIADFGTFSFDYILNTGVTIPTAPLSIGDYRKFVFDLIQYVNTAFTLIQELEFTNTAFGFPILFNFPLGGPGSRDNGMIFISTPSGGQSTVGGVFEKLEGTFSIGAVNKEFVLDANTLKYTRNDTRKFEVKAVISISNNNTADANFKLALNGSVIDDSLQQTEIRTGGKLEQVNLLWQLSLTLDDKIDIFVATDANESALEAQHAVLTIVEV